MSTITELDLLGSLADKYAEIINLYGADVRQQRHIAELTSQLEELDGLLILPAIVDDNTADVLDSLETEAERVEHIAHHFNQRAELIRLIKVAVGELDTIVDQLDQLDEHDDDTDKPITIHVFGGFIFGPGMPDPADESTTMTHQPDAGPADDQPTFSAPNDDTSTDQYAGHDSSPLNDDNLVGANQDG
jgi:hypothetical protein